MTAQVSALCGPAVALRGGAGGAPRRAEAGPVCDVTSDTSQTGQSWPQAGGALLYEAHFAPLPVEPFFVDWITIRQTHVNWDLPLINAGMVRSTDSDGVLEWESRKPRQFEGSFETSLRLSCDGHTVSLSGNVSRFGRADNLFGLSLGRAIAKASDIVGRFGLPPFTAGREMPIFRKRNGGEVQGSFEYDGAKITRLDLTQNYATGSRENAVAYMQFLASQQHSRRVKVGTFDNQTVDWGRGSRRLYAKAYDKSAECRRHGAPDEVVRYCDENGIIRFELTAKATQLQSMGCQTLGGLHMGHLINLFDERRQVMTRATMNVDDLDTLPRALRCTARDYLAGDDLAKALSERTFRRHRAGLLAYGIDIAVPSHVSQFRQKVRIIELQPAAVPDWYELEECAA